MTEQEKKQLIEDAYCLNLQNLSGREDFEEAFKLGIETGVDETLEKLGLKYNTSKTNDMKWIKIDPTKKDTIPDENVWVFHIEKQEVQFMLQGEWIPLNTYSHYKLIEKPKPPQ